VPVCSPERESDATEPTASAIREMANLRKLGKRPVFIAALATLGAALLTGALLQLTSSSDPHPLAAPTESLHLGPATYALSAPSSPSSPSSAARAPTARRPGRTSTPAPLLGAQLRIPNLRVAARITPVASPAGILQVPQDPHVLGWWDASASPRSKRGSIVIDGHVNYNGVSGALAVLPRMHPGDLVTVQLPGDAQTYSYAISKIRNYPKSPGLPANIFDQTGPNRLVLITCGGPFDTATGSYEYNVIAFANPVR
jgi:hypothetical protein